MDRFRFDVGDEVIVNITKEWMNEHYMHEQSGHRIEMHGCRTVITNIYPDVQAFGCSWRYYIKGSDTSWCDEVLLPANKDPERICGSIYG